MANISISGGNKWRAVPEKLAQKVEVRAGVLEGATNEESGLPVATYAAYNEFGTARIPARPFMRTTLTEQRQTWIEGFGRLLVRMTPEQAAVMTGRRMAQDIQAKILSNMPPPNKKSTSDRKAKKEGPRGTLVDTGTLAKSIDFEVNGQRYTQ